MRVQGSKVRVRLTEVELEPAESKPILRVAPAAATLVWLGSIAVATAIYLDWLPARALFDTPSDLRGRPSATRQRAPRAEHGVAAATPPRASTPMLAPRPDPGSAERAPPRVPEGAAPAPPVAERTPITQSGAPAQSPRTIRGSYYSDSSHWAGGW